MGLSSAVQGATHVIQQITWLDEQEAVVDLSGATISGYKRNTDTREVTALDGTLALVDAENGAFRWTYGENDVAEPGKFRVQFIATYGASDLDKTIKADWIVHNALDDEVG